MFVRSAALYLTLGIYGVVFFFIGIYTYIIDFSVWHRLRTFMLAAKLPRLLAALFLNRVPFNKHNFSLRL